MNAFLLSMQQQGAKVIFEPPVITDAITGRWTPPSDRKAEAAGRSVTPALYSGEVPADPKLLCLAAKACG